MKSSRFKDVAGQAVLPENNTSSVPLRIRRSTIESLEKELLKRANTGKDYTDILEQLEALRDAKQELVLEDADNVNAKRHLAMIEAFLETQQTKIQEYDEDLVRKLLHQVTVYDDHLTFEFKSGLEVEISM